MIRVFKDCPGTEMRLVTIYTHRGRFLRTGPNRDAARRPLSPLTGARSHGDARHAPEGADNHRNLALAAGDSR